jgi:HTH-type transcriptional regulator/antitoxin HigA
MGVATHSERTCGRLLARVQPCVIRTEEENEGLIAELEKLDTSGHPLSPEQERLAELLTTLIEQFEEQHYAVDRPSPVEAMKALMEERGLRQRDLIPVFGASSVVSDVIHGKRGISKAHTRKLAAFSHAPIEIFI